jgi:hypothetical protein
MNAQPEVAEVPEDCASHAAIGADQKEMTALGRKIHT